jgi:hypothetical protein
VQADPGTLDLSTNCLFAFQLYEPSATVNSLQPLPISRLWRNSHTSVCILCGEKLA